MKRKLTILGDQKFVMKVIFDLSDYDVEQVKKFMEDEYRDVLELLRRLISSDRLSEKQKILAGYIVGNTFGVSLTHEMEYITKDKDRPVDTM